MKFQIPNFKLQIPRFFFLVTGGLMLVILAFQSCNFSSSVNVNISAPAFQKLSEYHFFRDEMKNLFPNENVLPYDLITPLFSDYAEKARFVWMPQNTSATYNDSDVFDFPDGTVLIKNFYYPFDFRNSPSLSACLCTQVVTY